ncbi:MAG TPA: M48 family metalloprotease [Bryobacteraceae bacterium]|nr:M48 family metalloprotease [Bryobacteraceae bacterium]
MRVTPRPNGDVSLSIYAFDSQRPHDLAAILRSALPCDWHGKAFPSFLDGTCRQLLHTNRGAADDRLTLAPLAKALLKSGFQPVRIMVTTKSDFDGNAATGWARQDAAKSGKKQVESTWSFQATSEAVLPPPFVVHAGTPWNPARLGAPFLFVLAGPPLLAIWVRRQMERKNAAPGSGLVWLNWILLGCWLYWISAVRIDDLGAFATSLGLHSVATLALGSLFFSLPPLLAVTFCLLILSPQAQPGSQPGQLSRLLRRTLTAEATFMVPLGLFLMGTTLMQDEWRIGLCSMVASYGVYRLLAWCGWRWDTQRMLVLYTGELRERAVAIAQMAGAAVKQVCILENRYPTEANAFAMSGGRIAFTRGLVESMTRREVDSVIAHEVGHLRGKHIGMRTGLFLAYFFVIGPFANSMLAKAGLPAWIEALPIVTMLYVVLAGQLSQSHELNADARAVQLTNDPEGTIGALARLARLTRSPIDWGGIQGSILSHPSMQRRVLSVARRSGVPEARALEILQNPDVLVNDAADPAASRYALPPVSECAESEFTATAKMSHAYWSSWVFGGTLICLLIVLAWIATQPFYGGTLGPVWAVLVFFVGLPPVGWLTQKFDDWWDCLFIRRMRRRVDAKSQQRSGIPVALLPGGRVFALESMYAWDLGRIGADLGRLTYCGERTKFAIDRADVTSIEIRKSTSGWCRTYAVVLRSTHGDFSFRLADLGRTRRLAKRLDLLLRPWWGGGVNTALPKAGEGRLPAPDLPNIQPALASRFQIAWVFVIRTALLFVATIALFTATPMINSSPMFAFVPFTAPLVYLAVVCPAILRSE